MVMKESGLDGDDGNLVLRSAVNIVGKMKMFQLDIIFSYEVYITTQFCNAIEM